MKHNSIQVLIVGAGPTGLMMACQLARLDIPFRIIDKNTAAAGESRALAIQARSLEIFQQMGIAEKALDMGVKMTGLMPILNGKPATHFSFEASGKGVSAFPFVLMLEQNKTEALLLEFLRERGIEVEREMKLMQLENKKGHVLATVRRAYGGIEEIAARWIIGADGAGSTVRHLLGLSFRGGTYQRNFALADVKVTFTPNSSQAKTLPQNTLIANIFQDQLIAFFPMKGEKRYRMVTALPQEISETEAKAITFENIQKPLENNGYLDFKMEDCQWFSTYKIHHRCVAKFRKGRCFLAGDAAHIHSPLGGQGMNTGFQDAYNLAWKLALVIRKQAKETLLDTYHKERYPVARHLLRTTDALFSMIVSKNPLVRVAKYRVAPKLLQWLTNPSFAGKRLFQLLSQTGINYKNSTISSDFPNIPIFRSDFTATKFRAGERVPYCQITQTTVREKADIHQLFTDTNFHVLLFVQPNDTAFQAAAHELEHLLDTEFNNKFVIHKIFETGNEAVFRAFGVKQSTLFLIRPDVYIAYRSTNIRLKHLREYLTHLLGLQANNNTSAAWSVRITTATV